MSKRRPYGNVKMKGKREKLLSCGCCVAENNKSYQEGINRGAAMLAREIDREVLEVLDRRKKF